MCTVNTTTPTINQIPPAILAGAASPHQIAVQKTNPPAGSTTSAKNRRRWPVVAPHPELPDHRKIHAHEPQKSAEIEDLGGDLITHYQRADIGEQSDQQDVVIRSIPLGM